MRPCGDGGCTPRSEAPFLARCETIQPGESLFQPATPEIVFRRMPRDCAEGITTDAVDGYLRVVPPRGHYTLTVLVAPRPRAYLGTFAISVPSERPFQSQTITL